MDDSGVLSIINGVTGRNQPSPAALPAVLSSAAQSGTTPDQEAEWQRLARESNVPVGLIRNGAPVKLMQLQQQAADLPATNPVTAQTLMNPDNAAVAHDDIGTLTRLEDLAKNGFGGQGNSPVSTLQFGTPRDQAEANYFATEYGTKPFQSIQGGSGKLATKLAFPVAAAVDAVNGDDYYKEFASQLYDTFSQIQKDSAPDPSQTFGGKLVRSLQELAPMIIPGMFSPVLGVAGMAEIVGQATNDKYDELTAKGVDPDTALAMAMKSGMTAYAMTKLPFGGTSLSNSLARGAMFNPAFGALDRGLEKAGLNYVGYNKLADDINLFDPETMAHDLAMGLLFGAQHAIQSGRPVMGDGLMESLVPFYDQYQAGRRTDALTEIGKVVQDSKVNGRAPDMVQQHLSDVASEHAGIENAYVPVDRWNELFQSAGLDPAAVADEVLSNPEAYHEANKTGSDIVIPFGEFTGKLSGLPQYGELVKDARLSLGDTSLREAEAHVQAVKDNAENGGGFIDTLKNMFARSQEAVKGNESYGKIYDDLVGQQLGIGTERGTAEHNAQLVANAFRVLGERAGIDPFELYSNYNLKLACPMDSALTDRVDMDTSILNQKNIADAKENISELYDLALGTTNENRKIDIAPVPAWKVKAVADAVAIDGYRHQVDTYSIRHTLRQHGDSVREQKRGQLQITKDDILSIPETVLSPDSIAYGVKNSRGQDLIASVKRMPDGTLLVVEEVRTGRKTLSMASVRKYPAAKDSDSVARTLLSNARSDGGNPHLKIVHPGDNVKPLFQTVAGRLAADGARDFYQSGNVPVSHDFVKNAEGKYAFGEITPEIGLAVGHESAPILLRNGDSTEGLTHIEERHKKDYEALGYNSAVEFVQDIIRNAGAVYQAKGRALDLVVTSGKLKFARIQLEPHEEGSYYDIKTATPGRSDQYKNKQPLWENAGPSASTEEYQSPLIPEANAAAFEKRTGDKTTTDTLALTGKDDTASLPTDPFLDSIINSKLSDVNALLQSAVNHLATDGVKVLYQSARHNQSDKPVITFRDGANQIDIQASGNIDKGVKIASMLPRLDVNNLFDSKTTPTDEAIRIGTEYYHNELEGHPVEAPAFNGERVSFTDLGLAHLIVKHERKLPPEDIARRLKLLPKTREVIATAKFADEVRIEADGNKYGLMGVFKDGTVLRVVVQATVREGKVFLTTYDWEDVSKKMKQHPSPELLPSAEVIGVGEAPASTDKKILNQDVKNVKDNLPDDTDALWAKLKAPLLPESEASTTPRTSDDHVKKVVTGVLHSAITRIKTPADAAHIAFPLAKRAQEAAIAIVTDAKGNVLGVIQHSTGGLDSTTMSPRDLLGVVHDFPGAAEVWFAHNHPTGDPSPSPEDITITSRLATLLDGSGIKTRGMIVVGQTKGAVWTEGKGGRSKKIPLSSLNTDKERTQKITTYDREIIKLPSSERFDHIEHVIDYARQHGDGDSGIIIIDGQAKPVSFVPMSVAEMAELKTGEPTSGSSAIMSAFHKGNGTSMVMVVPALPGSQAAARNMTSFGTMFGAPLSDVIDARSGLSFRNTGRMPEALDHFFQGGDAKRGYIRYDNNRNFEIGLLKDANLSTFIHESGHFFTEVLGDLAERPDAPQQIKDDYASLLKFAGVDSRDAIQTEHHEKLAQAFEKYIMEGHAPSVELHGMFQRMKAWMISVYRDMTALNVQLNPEVRDVFDRMLATDAEIERMRDMQDMKPLFATAAEAGMSQAEFELYRKDAEQAGELAKEQLLRKLMAEKSREQKSWWKDERKKTWAEVETEAKKAPVYQAYQVLTTGKTFDGREVGDIKLSREALVKMYGEAFVKSLPREFQRTYSKEGGLHPDVVAEMAGFGSGDEMVRKMASAPKMRDYIKAETDQRMRERYGDMMTDGSIHEQALKDVHNDAQGKVMRAELRAIQRKAKEVRPFVKAAEARGNADAEATARWYTAEGRAKEAQDRAERDAMLGATLPIEFFKITASEAMGAKRMVEIQPHLYSNAARAAARESFAAVAKGDYEKAGAAKYRELLNHYLYKEVARARDFADKVQVYAAKMGTMKELGKFGQAGGQFLDQIRAILDRYSFNRINNKEADERMQYRESLDAFLRRMKDEEGVELPIPDAVRQEAQRTNYRNLSMDELRGVYDSMRMLEHAARQVNQVNAEGRKVAVAQAALSMANKLFRSIKGAADMVRKSDGAASLLDRVKNVNLDISVLLPEFVFERFDDGREKTGPWHEFIWDRYNDAADHQIWLREMFFPKIMEYAHSKAIDRSMGKIHIDSLNADLVKDDIIAIAMNCGNASNLVKLLRGGLRFNGDEAATPLNHDALQEILSHLSAKEIDVVNGIWETVDTLKPEAAELARKRTGVELNWIEALPMQIKNGTLEGGYYPVKYDARYSSAGEKQYDSPMIDQMFNKYASNSTRQGYMKERTTFAAPMSLDWQSIISRHLDEVITDISHWQFVTDTQRLLRRPEVKDAIHDRLGSVYYKNLLDWVRYTVNQDNVSPEASGNIEKFRRQIRSNISAYALGFKVAHAVNEMAIGIPLMMQQVKIASAFKGIMQYLRNPVEATRFATQASDYMRNIDKSFDRDITQALNSLAGRHSVVDDIRHWSIASRAFFLKIGAVMAWHAGYIDAQEQGLQGKESVRIADSIYRMTQESGRAGDLSAVQRNTYMKELTQFIGPSLIQYNNRRAVMPWQDMGFNRDTAALGLTTLLAGHVANAVIFEMLRGKQPDELENLPAWILARLTLGLFDGFPLMRDIADYVEGKTTGENGKDIRPSPVLQWGKDVVDGFTKTVKAAADEGEWNKAIIQDAKAVGGANGLPSLAGSTIGQYIYDVLSGDYTPEHPWSPVTDLFYKRKGQI